MVKHFLSVLVLLTSSCSTLVTLEALPVPGEKFKLPKGKECRDMGLITPYHSIFHPVVDVRVDGIVYRLFADCTAEYISYDRSHLPKINGVVHYVAVYDKNFVTPDGIRIGDDFYSVVSTDELWFDCKKTVSAWYICPGYEFEYGGIYPTNVVGSFKRIIEQD